MRMLDEDGDLILPGAFLPAAERYNLIHKIDSWVVTKAIELLNENTQFLKKVDFISINLSGISLIEDGFLEFVIKKLKESDTVRNKICFEITETAVITNFNMAIKFITSLKEIGCRFALDDFGSGLSSYAYLKRLPVNYLKIDGFFIKNITSDPIDFAMVKSILEIGNVMKMETIAEYVENDEIRIMLEEAGVNFVQGNGIASPQPFNELLIEN